MEASETIIKAIIEGEKQYIVPLFQRAYVWTKKKWEDLWNDLIELVESRERQKLYKHFMGSIVTAPAKSVPEGVTKYLLIDGQQRLTTILILLSVLRDSAKNNPEKQKLSEQINNTLLTNPYQEDLDFYKLQPTHSDRISFHKVLKSDLSYGVEEDQIMKAYKFFERKLKQIDIPIEVLKNIIIKDLSIVSIVLGKDDNPHLVFETLNARGTPLKPADLIRNYFLMQLHVGEQEIAYAKYWKPLEEAIEDNVSEFTRHYLMKDGNADVRISEVYFDLKDKVGKTGDPLASLTDLFRYSKYYEKLLYPLREEQPELREALSRLNVIETTTAYPFLLNCYEDYSQNKLSLNEFVSILNAIENFMVRRFVCNVPTHGLKSIFPPLYSQIIRKNPENFVQSFKQILQTKNYPKVHEFRRGLQESRLYGSNRIPKITFILKSIEEYYEHKEQVKLDNLTVEHIMPQTLTDEWQAELEQHWEATHELFIHTLGNLTLTGYNVELSNSKFEEKKKLLLESHLEMNKYFDKVVTWNREEIEKHAKYLADRALLIWPYFGDELIDKESITTAITGTVPTELWILGQYFVVRSWRDVLEQALNTIADLEPEKFETLINNFPRFISRNPENFREVRKLNNGVFFEVNLSSKDIYRFCTQAIEAIDLTEDEWKVERYLTNSN